MLDEQAPSIGRVITHLADPDSFPCLVHCHAGKDRTGLVIALALEIAGVARETVLADYAASTAARMYRRQEVSAMLAAVGTTWERVEPLFTAPPQALSRAGAH